MSFLLAPRKPDHPSFDGIAAALRRAYSGALNEPVPRDMLKLIDELK